MPLRYAVLGMGCAPLLQCLGQLSAVTMLHCELLYPYTLLHFSLVAFTRGRTDHRTRQTTANPSRVIYVYFVHIVVGKLVSKFIVKYT